ncbi:VacJ family lipoprotein [Stenotrophomonas sp. MMGLT7]|uniref:MlaA family lipoprotein n=1 Tax=Stenotrophomonas sp. MMGLT7 TaxID=2901227 RepID=UPI001E3F4E61|nr:VacJ family lipoprotein [Stenotrophomonas sp. MMGLT7]MCD7098452.1 VacJ family lipoprotein [Stenotrophomonas sp. MMGLT7]
MLSVRTFCGLALGAVLTACASQPQRQPAPSPSSAPAAASATTDTAAPAQQAAAGEAGTPTQADDDFAALYGGESAGGGVAYDPWENYNRRIHRFNVGVDRYVARPVATAYTKVVPGPARRRVTDFFRNLTSPATMVNQVLQGRPGDAWVTFGRFLINTTVGIGGLFDPATRDDVPRTSEDFGQTLAVWGWRNSRYFELPFLGPRTVRDTFGIAGDTPLSPIRYVERDRIRFALQGLQLVDTRVKLMPLDDLRANAPDEYALIRDGWMQRRNYMIQSDREGRGGNDELNEDSLIPSSSVPIP